MTGLLTQRTLTGDDDIVYGGRDELDRYYTPAPLVSVLAARGVCFEREGLSHVGSRVLEPCAGRALSIASALERWGHEVTTADVDLAAPVDLHVDATGFDFKPVRSVVSNPPFNVAADVIRNALPRARWVAMLLRLTFLEPVPGRADLLQRGPAQLLVLPRTSFYRGSGKKKTDSVTCAWMVWQGDMHPDQAPGCAWRGAPGGTLDIITPEQVARAHADWGES